MMPSNNFEWLILVAFVLSLGVVAWSWWYTHLRKPRGPNDSAAQQMRVPRRASP